MFKKICVICGKEYEPDKRNYRRQLTCSIKCSCRNDTIKERQKVRQARQDVNKNCLVCGQSFLAHYRNVHQIYCSKSCAMLAMHKRAVETGSKKLYAKAYYEKHKEDDLQRSRKNRNIRDFGGNRLKAIERDGHKCALCGYAEKLVVHHKDVNRKNNSLENLQTLCHGCHGRIHNTLLPERKCEKEGCDRKHYARGMCIYHYNKWLVS